MKNKRVHKKLTDGIIYLFQYGYISEKKHFHMLDALNEADENTDSYYNPQQKF